MKMLLGIAVILIFTSASVMADDVLIDVMEDEQLGGAYFSNTSDGSWYIKFSAKVDGEEIVSICEIVSADDEEFHAELTELKFPYTDKGNRKIDHMQTRVVSSARDTAQVLESSELLPAAVDDIADAFWDMADSLAKKTADMGKNEIRFAVMYHSVIIQAALRIMKGAKNTKDICEVSPDYEATGSSSLFICVQDLPHLKHSLITQEPRRRFDRQLACWGYCLPNCRASIRQYCNANCGDGLQGSDWGCCSNYPGLCCLANRLCRWHDEACTCCAHWWCLWGCKCDSHCPPSFDCD